MPGDVGCGARQRNGPSRNVLAPLAGARGGGAWHDFQLHFRQTRYTHNETSIAFLVFTLPSFVLDKENSPMPSNKHHPASYCLIYCSLLIILLAACTSSPTTKGSPQASSPTPSARLGAPGCHPPSPSDTAAIGGIPEVQGTATGGSLWALFFNWPIHPREDVKIVWRMTGVADFNLVVQGPHGMHIRPLFGPVWHGSSNWSRPGAEWGTGYNFPIPGCWDLHATRGTVSGDVWLLVQ